MQYARRIIDDELDELFGQVPAIAIDGPKAVGKTTTAEQRVVGLLRLDENPTVRRCTPTRACC
jgi:predicted AAA+ superfamily ATPase